MTSLYSRVFYLLALYVGLCVSMQEDDIVPETSFAITQLNHEESDAKPTVNGNAMLQSSKSKRKYYSVAVTVGDRRFSGSKDSIEIQLEGKNGEKTPFIPLGSKFKLNEKRKKRFLLKNIGDAEQVSLVRLRSNGGDGLLVSMLEVSTGKKHIVKKMFSAGFRFLMCRKEDPPRVLDACTISLTPVAATGDMPSCVPACPAVNKLPPAPLTSDYKLPTPDHGHNLRTHSTRLQYDGFAVEMDCSRNAAFRFEYMTYADCGCHPRHHGFRVDPDKSRIGRSCQQKNGKAYKKTRGVAFDRGHLVPANHLDHDKDAITQSNYMTNILPQAAYMNRGAWLETEELVECLRDKEPLHVVGGAVWDSNDPRYNWFQKSHNVKNPSFFWKVVTAREHHKDDHHRIAFWLPNNEVAKRGTIDKYVVSIATLEENLAKYGQPQSFDIPQEEKQHTPKEAWNHIPGCNKAL
jgi:endonuclease G